MQSRHLFLRRRIVRGLFPLIAVLLPLTIAQSAPAQTVSADPIRTVLPVHFDATTGDIIIGSTACPIGSSGCQNYTGANPGFHILAINRQPNASQLDKPTVVWDRIYADAALANNALQSIQEQCAQCLLMVNAAGNHGVPLNSVAQSLEKFGAYPDLQQINAVVPFIFVGIGGTKEQTALQRGGSTRNLDGYLAQDSNGNYAFIRLDFVLYDIITDGTITIGGKAHKAIDATYKPGCDGAASDSFHLLVVDRESPDVVLTDSTYCTRPRTDLLASMASDLSGVQAESSLIFIATNGHPIPPDVNFNTGGDLRVYLLARQMARLGGYYETMAYLGPNDTYSLVGAVAPPTYVKRARDRAREASSVYPAYENGGLPSGALHGVLSRGRGNWYSPLNADPSGTANLGLYEILAQPPSTFPQFTGDQLTAYNFIIQRLVRLNLCSGLNCIRNAYSSLNIDLTATYLTPIEFMQGPSNEDCNSQGNADLPFCTVRQQLLSELTNAINVRTLYTNMFDLWSASGSVNVGSSLSAYNTVKSSLPAAPTAQSPSLVRPLVTFFLGLAGNLPVVGQAFGLANTGFNLGMDLATDANGNKTVDLTSTIGQLEQQAVDHFIAQGTTLGTMFQVVLEDSDKLNALGSKLVNANDPSSAWHWDLTTTTRVVNALDTAVQQAAYQNVMAAAYAIGSYLPGTSFNCFGFGPNPVWGQLPLWQQPRAYVVLDTSYTCGNAGNTPAVTPFAPPDTAVYVPYTYPNDPNNPLANDPHTNTIMADFNWLAISLQNSPFNSGPGAHYDPPDGTLMSKLFTPLQQKGLGVYRPAFFEGWPFPRITCEPSYGVRPPGQPGESIGGCNWSSAQTSPPPPPPGAAMDIAIRANQISKTGEQVKLMLAIFNRGTERVNSIEITSIVLRTLGGTGQATVLSPALPTRVLNLAPGDSTDVAVTLNIPPTITKLGITEQGFINAAGPVVSRFSQAQALYPR